MPRLFILSGPDSGKSVEVEAGATLGRAVECTVCLHDRSVSRQHARLEKSGTGWKIVDAQSRNGVSVRGKRVPEAALADGDEFLVGEVLLRFRLEPAPAPVAEPDEPDEPDEIVLEPASLEEPPLETLRAPAPLERTMVHAPPSLPAAPRIAPASTPPGVAVQRGQRVLQYHKIPDREGFFASDLAQQPLWIKVGAGLLALTVFAVILLFAFKGTTLLKSRVDGGSAESSAPDVDELPR